MNKYSKWLEEGYRQFKDITDPDEHFNRAVYLSEYIFNFITYDSEVSESLVRRALDVCKAINEGRTISYIKAPDAYLWYLIMVNTDFFSGKLDWGISIRGAWWNHKIYFVSHGLQEDGKQLGPEFNFSGDEWKEFIVAILEFAEDEE